MTLEIDVYWSFRSPYSYLAAPRLRAWPEEFDLVVHPRIVLPIAVRIDGFFERVNPLWPPYLVRDVKRIADSLGLGFAWPQPDPIVQDFANRRIPKEQPYIHRLTRLGVAAVRRGRGLAFLDEVSRLIWDGSVRGWNEGDHLAKAAARAGLDLSDLEHEIARDDASLDAEVEDHHAALERAGHWGVPTMVFRGEAFFGQDRMDLLLWRLRQHGLRKRDGTLG